MKQLGLFITQRCNLKCRLCSGHIPYVKEPEDEPLWILKRVIDNYFACVDFVKKIVITGGETFLYKDLAELLQYLYQYKNRFEELELFTNGTIVPEEKCLLELQRFEESRKVSVKIFIDDYGAELSKGLDRVAFALAEKNITYIVRNYNKKEPHCGGWVDFGDLKTVLWTTEEEKEKVKQNCAFLNQLGGCHGTSDGILYPCTPARIQAIFGLRDKSTVGGG
ncbi:MAG: radical SAM protein [Acetivibrio ethanolgignens]